MSLNTGAGCLFMLFINNNYSRKDDWIGSVTHFNEITGWVIEGQLKPLSCLSLSAERRTGNGISTINFLRQTLSISHLLFYTSISWFIPVILFFTITAHNSERGLSMRVTDNCNNNAHTHTNTEQSLTTTQSNHSQRSFYSYILHPFT